MSIVEGTRLRTLVYPSQEVVGEFGATELQPGDPLGAAEVCYGTITRPAADTNAVGGYDTSQAVSFVTRAFPWLARSVVEIEGELWDVESPPVYSGLSLMTRRATVRLVARGPGPAAQPDGRIPGAA